MFSLKIYFRMNLSSGHPQNKNTKISTVDLIISIEHLNLISWQCTQNPKHFLPP